MQIFSTSTGSPGSSTGVGVRGGTKPIPIKPTDEEDRTVSVIMPLRG